MSTVYRSYEVLIEETARNHHARKAGKTKKELHPNHLNTEQALKTTHEVFQDAVCYYILCILGLIKGGTDRNGKVASPLWNSVTAEGRLGETHDLVKRLAESYPAAPFSAATTVEEFLSAVYGERTTTADRAAVMAVLLAQIQKKDGTLDCGDFAEFARDNGLRFCSSDSTRALPGCAPIDRLFWRMAAAKEPSSYWDIIKDYWKELARTPTTTERDQYLKAFEDKNNKQPLGISTDLFEQCRDKIAAAQDFADFIWFHKSGPIGTLHYAIARYSWLSAHHTDSPARSEAEAKLGEYVRKVLAKDFPETEHNKPVLSEGSEVVGIPGTRPTFPYFTNLMGCAFESQGFRQKFDESALKRAFDEVFKYRNRSEDRERLFSQRHAMVKAMESDGTVPLFSQKSQPGDGKRSAKAKKPKKDVKPRNLGGLKGDDERKKAMNALLGKIGGQIGYGLRRATIGGWAELRNEFLKYARKAKKEGDDLDEEELIEIVTKAQGDSAGGFGSAAFFRELCKEENHILWLPKAEELPEHCPKNFVRWWVIYSEAKGELEKIATLPKGVTDWKDAVLKPISFTWPGTKNRHNEESFRPLDFACDLTSRPVVQLFHREKKGAAIKLVETNSQWVMDKDEKWSWKLDLAGEVPYPMTLSFRRLKRDKLVRADGNSFESSYGIPLAAIDKAPLPDMQPEDKPKKPKNLSPSVSLLPPDKMDGPFHLMFAFDVEAEALQSDTKRLPGLKPLRTTKKNGKWVGLNARWSVDAKTEGKVEESPTIAAEEEEPVESGGAFKVKELWSELDSFEPFDILSIDLGVRFTAAWSRNQISMGAKPSSRAREISPHGHKHQIWFDSYQRGALKLQGEDAEEYRKEKGEDSYPDKPLPEKYGTKGRLASDAEREQFAKLAVAILPESKRNALPEAEDQKFFPLLGDHLTWRLRRRLSRLKFLFTLRWRAIGKKDRFGTNDYRPAESEKDWKELWEKNLYKAIESLAFQPDEPEEGEEPEIEEPFMEKLRHALCNDDEIWKSLRYEHGGKTFALFRKVKGKKGKAGKADEKVQKEAQKKAQDALKKGLVEKTDNRWNWKALADEARDQIEEVMKAVEGQHGWIAEAAQFVWPLRDKDWVWHRCRYDGPRGELSEQAFLERDEQSSVKEKRHIRGMRGLNMRRIEVLQDFRRCLQSLAKIERRYRQPGTDHGLEPSKVELGDTVHEPAQAFLDNINELRDQRVFQTAHLILAEALGLQLMNPGKVMIDEKNKKELKSERDLHGRYEPKKDKDGKPLPRVSAIVLEDLGRYKTSQDRSRFENRQLMEWSHGKVVAKLQDMAQVFGIEIIVVDARFSSRYSSRTGAPGVRCAEVAIGFEKEQPWRRWSEEKVGKGKDRKASERAQFILDVAGKLKEVDDPKASLWLPLDGGPAFVPTISHAPDKEGIEGSADINAAVSVGLRAVAHPDRLDVFPVLRTEAKAEGELEIQNRRGSLSEAATKKAEERTVRIVEPKAKPTKEEKPVADENVEDEDGDDELETNRKPYLYAAVKVNGDFSVPLGADVRYQLPMKQNGELVTAREKGCSAATGKDYWARVKRLAWRRLKTINAARLAARKCGVPEEWLKPDPDDDIP
ncbi:MAG: type V CRISPR-associated protein Cas12b [Verrucomicrobiaceae bacterium]|nr:type V CRISPR-associated protein Cas12b [Verrucomicrobiaceae bacterium]